MANSFKDLKIWQKGFELLMKVYDATSKYPREEIYSLVSDTRRSANSVIANIAESHGRHFYADQIRVLYIARGEVEEVRSHLAVAWKRGYIKEEIFQSLDKEYEGLAVGINFYINNLEKQKNNCA